MRSQAVPKPSLLQTIGTFVDEWLLFVFSGKLKFAIKVSLSLTLAYMIPMAMGWAQPNTAAMTVMLIASAGGVSESVMKGLIRVVGTLLGALIGLSLIALFPQERLLYLLFLSLAVAAMIYLYYAYQGDSTVFMLGAMVMMMVFLQGPEDAFLYGVDRTYMTIFGIVVYTVIGVFLWPVRLEDTTEEDAIKLSSLQSRLFDTLSKERNEVTSLLEKMEAAQQRLQHSYASSSDSSLAMALDASTWNAITDDYRQVGLILNALAAQRDEPLDYARYVEKYEVIDAEIRSLFAQCEQTWRTQTSITLPGELQVIYSREKTSTLTHLQRSKIVTHVELLKALHLALRRLGNRLNTLHGATLMIPGETAPPRPSRFVWLDPEYLKATLQLFLVFWATTLLWILFDPPGGFLLVTLATLMGLLTTFSPLRPALLMVLFSIGFMFATLMYVFVLPQLVYGWELALFIFFYAFIAFYLISAKLTIFFLIGMFLLGIENTMSYQFDLFLSTLLVFYLFLAILMFFHDFPFSSRPEYLFRIVRQRLFEHARALLELSGDSGKRDWIAQRRETYHLRHLLLSSAKMRLWGSLIDSTYFKATTKEDIMGFSTTCEHLASDIEALLSNLQANEKNTLLKKALTLTTSNVLAEAADQLVNDDELHSSVFARARKRLERLEAKLDELKTKSVPDDYSAKEISGLYVDLALRHTVWVSLERCHEAMGHIDWQELKANRF